MIFVLLFVNMPLSSNCKMIRCILKTPIVQSSLIVPFVIILDSFAAVLRDKKVWVMNVVSIDSPDTLPVIYERGLFGMYHDWCESFSTYPRTYDLLHADHLFSRLKKRSALYIILHSTCFVNYSCISTTSPSSLEA